MPASLQNERLKLEVDEQGIAQVTDKKANLVWRQDEPVVMEERPKTTETVTRGIVFRDELPKMTSVKNEGDEIVVKAEWQVPLVMHWTFDAADEVLLRIDSPERETKLKSDDAKWGAMLMYPFPFYAAGASPYLVVPEDEGCLYSTEEVDTEKDPFRWMWKRYSGGDGLANLSMPFNGVTDLKRGCMHYIESTFHAAGRMTRYNTADGERALPGVGLTASRGTWGYERKIRFKFIDEGGYVAMAKRFREDVIKNGQFKTLKEKAQERPSVAKLKGAMDLWVFTEEPLTAKDIERIHSFGFDNLLFQVFVGGIHPTPEQGLTPEAVEAVKKIGWLNGYYHLYSWLYSKPDTPPNEEQATQSFCGPDGKAQLVGGGVWGSHYLRCPSMLGKTLAEEAKKEKEYGLTTFFTDCTFCGDCVRDCYSADHPLTVEESAFALAKAQDDVTALGMVVGSERGFWFGAKNVDFFEGIETLIQYFARFNGPDIPHMHSGDMREDMKGFEELMVGYNYGPQNRVPLFQLVFHDAVVCIRRWDDHHSRVPRLWRINDLMNIGYGTPAIVCFHTKAGPHILREDFEPLAERYLQTYKDVGEWHAQIGFEEMTGHRFLTEDRLVQETTFGNGKSVVVNYSQSDWKDPRGFVVAAMGFRTNDE